MSILLLYCMLPVDGRTGQIGAEQLPEDQEGPQTLRLLCPLCRLRVPGDLEFEIDMGCVKCPVRHASFGCIEAQRST